MLRFSYAHSPHGQRWILSGRLSGPWVQELRSHWYGGRDQAGNADVLVDVREVTFIDDDGEKLLIEMHRDGAEFLGAGVENKHLLDTLGLNGKRSR